MLYFRSRYEATERAIARFLAVTPLSEVTDIDTTYLEQLYAALSQYMYQLTRKESV